jgi:hypothetical protein
MRAATLLVVSPDEESREQLATAFRALGHHVLVVRTLVEAAAFLGGMRVDAVLVRGDDALYAQVTALAGATPVLLVDPPLQRGAPSGAPLN